MTPFLQMLLWTTAAGVCMPIGAALARIERIRPQWLEDEFRHTLIAIGAEACFSVPSRWCWSPRA